MDCAFVFLLCCFSTGVTEFSILTLEFPQGVVFFLSAFQMKAFFDRMLRLAARKIFLKIKTLYIHTQIQLAFLALHI